MNKRPRIKLQLNQTDKILEILGWVSVVRYMGFNINKLFYITGNNSNTF